MKRIEKILGVFLMGLFLFSSCSEEGMNDLPAIDPEIIEFQFEGLTASGELDRENRTIFVEVPLYVDVTSLVPDLHLSYGSTVSPAPGESVDFTNPVDFVIKNGDKTITYKVTVELGSMDTKSSRLLVLGTADKLGDIENPDEKAAASWALNTFALAQYMSFNQLSANTTVLEETDVVWWHNDTSYELQEGDFALPSVAYSEEIVDALNAYRNNGGGIYLSGFATQYLEPLEIVEPGDGPNEVGGAPVEFDNPDNWGMSFAGHEDHPVFKGLRKEGDNVAFLISGGASRMDNKAWWVMGIKAFPSYGIDLASTEWDLNREVLVMMAEFPGEANQGKVIGFSAGAYDWYSAEGENTFLDNVEQVTENILIYLATPKK
jgi:hypothetical protein